MRLADGFAVVAPVGAVEAIELAGPEVVGLATPLLLEHPDNTTTAIAPTLAAATALRWIPCML
jgi:hypothetical protein